MSSAENNTEQPENNGPFKKPLPLRTRVLIIVVGTLALFMSGAFATQSDDSISYTEFMASVAAGEVASVDIDNVSGSISGLTADGTEFKSTGGGERGLSIDDERTLKENGVEIRFVNNTTHPIMSLLTMLIPIALIIGFIVFMNRRQGKQMGSMMQVGKSVAKDFSVDRPNTLFSDIAGYEGVKTEINEVVEFLQRPEAFEEIGARIPKGILLVGPPGTGKTQFARAVAGEAGCSFFAVSGSDFMEMFVGVGASRVRDMFAKAREAGKAIIFIDEIDSIGRKRGSGTGGGHDEREQTLNQLLAEMDGFESSSGVVVLAATNRPDSLDKALLRPGRFDRQIVVPLPEVEERRAILGIHCRDKRIGDSVDLDLMARATPGMSGADLANLANEAALIAVRRRSTVIEATDFENARDRVMLGAQRETTILTGKEKRATAYHEAGHALLATVLPNGDPLHKVTILPRGMALGVAWSLPGERYTYSKDFYLDTICKAMGGRAAEMLIFGHMNSGASNDIEQATNMARKMVSQYGMSDAIGPVMFSEQTTGFLGESPVTSKQFSEKTAELVDSEITKMLLEEERRAIETLTTHRRGLELVAEALLEKETLDADEVAKLIMQGIDESGIVHTTELNIATFGD